MKIEENELYLRKIEYSDTDDIIRWRNQDEIRKFFIYQQLITKEEHITWLEDNIATRKTEQFIIVDKKKEHSIGSVYLRDVDYKNKKAELGIFIGEISYLGKGYGSKAAKIILKYGFNELGLNKVFLRVLADNSRAIRSYEKVGFQQEGYFRKDVLINGSFHDLIFMALLHDEFGG